jgi:hypothetical protein
MKDRNYMRTIEAEGIIQNAQNIRIIEMSGLSLLFGLPRMPKLSELSRFPGLS